VVDRGGKPFPGRLALSENALRNLVENAIRHTKADAAIVVDVGPSSPFRVRDNGREGDAATRIRDKQGPGLGLKIVHRIAETHGGSFSFEEAPDGLGSIATLSFEAVEQGASARPEEIW
jgi:signal transduction histidine kinase